MSDQNSTRPVLSFFTSEAISRLLSSALTILAPVGATILTVASGLWNSVPIWLLVPTGGLAFMTLIVTVNQLDQFFQRRNLRGRLKFAGFRFERSLEPDTRDEGYTVSIVLENMSDISIQYQVYGFEAALGDVRSREGKLPSKSFPVAPKAANAFKSGLIPGVRANQFFAVKVKIEIRYGRDGGKARHPLSHHWTFLCQTDQEGDVMRADLYSADDERDEPLIKALRAKSAVNVELSRTAEVKVVD
jgi:hypothetical protein